MKRSTKTYDLKNGYGIDCITIENEYYNTKWFQIDVVMLCVPWREVVESYGRISSSDEANNIFKSMVEKYRKLKV